jgi:hypothetical protein
LHRVHPRDALSAAIGFAIATILFSTVNAWGQPTSKKLAHSQTGTITSTVTSFDLDRFGPKNFADWDPAVPRK